jgi:hypothetical protein
MRRFFRLLTPRVGIAVLGATLGLTGTAFALSGHVAGRSSNDTTRHQVYGPGGSNRGCVYLTTRDCVYISRFHVGDVSVHGQTAFAHIRCTGLTECKVALTLTVRETERAGNVRAEAARAHARGHKINHHKSDHKRHHTSKGRHSSTGHKHGDHSGNKHGDHHGQGSSGHGSGHGPRHGHKPPTIVRTVQVGSAVVTVYGGHSGIYQVKLNGQGRTLLSQFGRLHVRFTARKDAPETKGDVFTRVLAFH